MNFSGKFNKFLCVGYILSVGTSISTYARMGLDTSKNAPKIVVPALDNYVPKQMSHLLYVCIVYLHVPRKYANIYVRTFL